MEDELGKKAGISTTGGKSIGLVDGSRNILSADCTYAPEAHTKADQGKRKAD